MERSKALKMCERLKIKLSAEQQAKVLQGEIGGLKFCVDFGYETPREEIDKQIIERQLRRKGVS
jgi:hypothetical protein